MDVTTKMILKAEVCERLRVSDRTLEKMVRAKEFPAPLRHGKWLTWSEAAVDRWQRLAVESQMTWEPPRKRGERRGGVSNSHSSAAFRN
jgi:prophage regulatory protein